MMASLAELTDNPFVQNTIDSVALRDATDLPKTRIIVRPQNTPDNEPVKQEDSKLQNIIDKLFGLNGQERYQLWPEKLVRDAISAPHDVMTGEIPQYTIDPVTGEAQTSPQMIKAGVDTSSLAGSGGLAGAGSEAGVALGSAPFLRPALKYGEKLYKGKPGQQHMDVIPQELYPTFQKQAMSGEDISNFNFGFLNHKGQFLNREDALKYAIDNGLIDPHSAQYGALTSTLMSDTAKPGAAIEAMANTNFKVKPPKILYRGITKGQQESGAEGLGTSHLGKGLYTSADKSFAKKYATDGDIREFSPEDAFPRNPLVLNGAGGAGSLLLDHIFRNTNLKNAREITAKYPDIGDYVKELGHDGVVVNKGEEIVKYPFLKSDNEAGLGVAALNTNKPFYSAVENAVAAAKQPKADAQQWLSFLKNQPGVKQEELTHLGLDKLQGSITKDDLLKAVQEGQPQIKEVVKGGNAGTKEKAFELAKEHGWKSWEDIDPSTQAKYMQRASREAGENPTKYHSYQLPGGPLSRDTEILTNKGWKRIDTVEIGDVVMTRQDDTDLLEWQPVEATTKVYAEELYHFYSQSINMRVTENHQMIAKKRRRNQNGLVRLTAKELWNKSEMIIPLTGNWASEGDKEIFGFNPNDLAELFGWYLAEGSCKLNKQGGKNTIQIAQCKEINPEKCARIEALLDRMNLPWRYYGGAYGIGIKTINKDLVELFHEQPHSEFKFVPYFFFEQSKSVIQSLLDGLILGDGCTAIQEGRLDKTTFFTKSEQLAGDVQILVLMTGKCATVRQRLSGLYCVGIKSKEWCSVDDAKFEIAPYNDFAFCVTVKNHAIYVRRFGVAAFTGNSNYREMLLTLPKKKFAKLPEKKFAKDDPRVLAEAKLAYNEKDIPKLTDGQWQILQARAARRNGDTLNEQYKSSHWDEPNVLAHIRMNDRTIDGKKTLHLEEIQSDWHQAGRKQGYKNNDDVNLNSKISNIDEKLSSIRKKEGTSDPFKLYGVNKEYTKLADERKALYDKVHANANAVPDAPFKKTWDELALKKAITHAVKNGYDQISWTPGEAQAARYDLSKQVDKVNLVPSDGHFRIDAFKDNKKVIEHFAKTESEIASVVGKEVAEKLLNNRNQHGAATVAGQDLKVGGQGMKAFYDKMLVDKMNALTKKYGGKVTQKEIPLDTKKPTDFKDFADWEKVKAESKKQPVHVLKITPELREQVLKKGFPLFSAGVPVFTPVPHNPFKDNYPLPNDKNTIRPEDVQSYRTYGDNNGKTQEKL